MSKVTLGLVRIVAGCDRRGSCLAVVQTPKFCGAGVLADQGFRRAGEFRESAKFLRWSAFLLTASVACVVSGGVGRGDARCGSPACPFGWGSGVEKQ